MIARAFAFCVVLVIAPAAFAQLSDAEKKLLQSAMTVENATQLGRAGDVEGLRRIIALGDPRLVRAYSGGTDIARIQQMPPAMEELLIAHFDDPRVGEALRDLYPRYRTRKVFDLHYARIQKAYRGDEPSFKQILRTDQDGIDEPVVRIADKYSVRPDELNPAMTFVARRHHAAAVPWLISSIEQGYRIAAAPIHNQVLSTLLEYQSPDIWRRASEELESLRKGARIKDEAYAAGRQALDRALADPPATLARMRANENRLAFERRRAAVTPSSTTIDALLAEGRLREYVDAQRKHLAQLDAIAKDLDDEGVAYTVGGLYFQLGLIVRFRLRDAREAAEIFAKSAAAHVAMGQVALADTYQVALNDKAAAAAAYQVALDEATRSTEGRPFWPYARAGTSMNNFWREWLARELEFVRTGKPFHGRIPEAVVGGFFDVIYGNANAFIDVLGEDVPLDLREVQGLFSNTRMPPSLRLAPAPSDWSDVEAMLGRMSSQGLSQKLEAVPASRLVLFVALPALSTLPPREMLRHFGRNDPSGYWTTCVLGTVGFLQSRPADQRRDLAVRNGVARLLPGLAGKGAPNALASASSQFLASRGLRVKVN